MIKRYWYIGGFVLLSAATPPAYPECPQVATAGGIKIYRCIDEDEGTIFYANSLGFMLLGE